jgi:hypothetical protein
MLPGEITIICGSIALPWYKMMAGFDKIYQMNQGADDSSKIGSMRAMFENWMKIPRKTHSSTREKQPDGYPIDHTAEAYQNEGIAFLCQPGIAVPLRIWHALIDSIPAYLICFLLALLLTLVAGLALGEGSRLSRKEYTLVSSLALFGPVIAVLASWTRNRPLYPCRMRLQFGRDEDDMDDPSLHQVKAIMQAIRQRKSCEPRDRAYGTYGVLRRLGAHLSEPNYSKPLGQVYQEYFVDLVSWDRSLIRLLVDAGRTRLPNTPSWVPDWSQTSSSPTRQGELYYSRTIIPGVWNPHSKSWEDTAERRAPSVVVFTDNQLTTGSEWSEVVEWVSGQFDHVETDLLADRSKLSWAMWDQMAWLGQWSLFFQQASNDTAESAERNAYHGPSKLVFEPQAIYHTLLLPRTVHCDPRDRFERSWDLALGSVLPTLLLIAELEAQARQEALDYYLQQSDSIDGNPWERNLTCEEALGNMVRVINDEFAVGGKKLFKAHNSVLGWTTADIRPGDFVTLIEGLPWPMVLRKAGTSTSTVEYLVVGQAFVNDEWIHPSARPAQPKMVTLV